MIWKKSQIPKEKKKYKCSRIECGYIQYSGSKLKKPTCSSCHYNTLVLVEPIGDIEIIQKQRRKLK